MFRIFENRVISWIFLFLLFYFFSIKIIKNFHDPIIGYGDTNNWEHTGFFLSKYLSFTPFPKIDFTNNGTLYPFGSTHVFQSWAFEKDFFWLAFYLNFGNGPWLKYYLLLSLSIGFFFSYFLLKFQFSHSRSFLISILLNFFNFYTILKYPYHFSYAILHWITIGFILDFLVLYHYVKENKLSFRFIFLRVIVTVLSFGLELGYVTGFGLTSLTMSYGFLLFYLVKDKKLRLLKDVKPFYQQNKILVRLIFLFAFIVFSFYVLLILQIFKSIQVLNIRDNPMFYWWSNPFRLFLPYFPISINLGNLFETLFLDNPDAIGSGSIGWFLLFSGIIGIMHSKNQIRIYLPSIVLTIILISYHPMYFPILKIFPWFQYMRVSTRNTLVLPIIFSLFAIGFDFNRFPEKVRKVVLLALIFLGLFELNHAFKLRAAIDKVFPKEFYSYMDKIKNLRGEAILDWPFCIYGANINDFLCKHYFQTIGSYSFTRFHEKKVIGQYYGRMDSKQLEPFRKIQIEDLFLVDPNPYDFLNLGRSKCFTESEWIAFSNFYNSFDFAGINLYTDIIGSSCAEQFYKRFGDPIAKVQIPYSGNMVLIPKKRN